MQISLPSLVDTKKKITLSGSEEEFTTKNAITDKNI